MRGHFDIDRLRAGRVAVIGAGHPHRERVWPVIERIVDALRSRGYRAQLVDAEEDSFVSRIRHFDAAYLALFGRRFGDDGTLQGLLATMGIRYSGSGCEASAIAQDKVVSKILFRDHGIPTPPFVELGVEPGADLDRESERAAQALGLPLVLKPVLEGGSFGLRLVSTPDEIRRTLPELQTFGRVFAEQFLRGRTLTSGVVGTGDSMVVLPAHEVTFAGASPFLDNETLAAPGMCEVVIPPRVSTAAVTDVERLALAAHRIVRAHGVSRSDFIVDDEGAINILELNTIPGMAAGSDLPIAAERLGIQFDELVERILLSALDRSEHDR